MTFQHLVGLSSDWHCPENEDCQHEHSIELNKLSETSYHWYRYLCVYIAYFIYHLSQNHDRIYLPIIIVSVVFTFYFNNWNLWKVDNSNKFTLCILEI